jgi:hypothetical protein
MDGAASAVLQRSAPAASTTTGPGSPRFSTQKRPHSGLSLCNIADLAALIRQRDVAMPSVAFRSATREFRGLPANEESRNALSGLSLCNTSASTPRSSRPSGRSRNALSGLSLCNGRHQVRLRNITAGVAMPSVAFRSATSSTRLWMGCSERRWSQCPQWPFAPQLQETLSRIRRQQSPVAMPSVAFRSATGHRVQLEVQRGSREVAMPSVAFRSATDLVTHLPWGRVYSPSQCPQWPFALQPGGR